MSRITSRSLVTFTGSLSPLQTVNVLLGMFMRRANVLPEFATIPARTGNVTGCVTSCRLSASLIASTWTQYRHPTYTVSLLSCPWTRQINGTVTCSCDVTSRDIFLVQGHDIMDTLF
jgi:hypothetical protein